MIRVVSFTKAVGAGAAAAIVWEAVIRALEFAGLPLFDIVETLGRLIFPSGPFIAWWSAGLALHAAVGALWAIFYAYFFWSELELKPIWQGMVFSLIPLTLAALVAYPQLHLMGLESEVATVNPFTPLLQVSWGDGAGLVLGHLIFGVVLGALYTHPVGYRSGRPHRIVEEPQRRPVRRKVGMRPFERRENPRSFAFATGIECSYPTIENGHWRVDEMDATGHYRRWRTDLEIARELGVTHLRYGPPLHLIYTRPGGYDWDFTDSVMALMRKLKLEPIIDLCHFGVPDWLENFQNKRVPAALGAYAREFAARYPWVRIYTPINEMYVCARMSALDGIWNEQRRDECSFVTAVSNLAKANILMSQAILEQRPDAILVHSESSEFFQACCPDPKVVRVADFENERKFLPLDLLYARPVSDTMRQHLFGCGMTPDDYQWFMQQTIAKRAILGVDYYEWNEKLVDNHGRPHALGELFGWYVVANQYYSRYRRPVMHTETNRMDAREGPRWLWRQWHNVQLLRKSGVPIVGFTWYSLTDQVDWDIALSRPLGTVNPVGLFDLNRDLRPVGLAYKHLIEIHRGQPGYSDAPSLDDVLKVKEMTHA
jgi:beta-glucosidase/6-phospho-beta-glucosidase/beta-galactosidase